jgi:hypothetical protein
LPSGSIPNASSLTKSRSIDFVLSYDLPRGIGLRGSWCFKTSDQTEKEYGAGNGRRVDLHTACLRASVNLFAGLRKIESRRPRVRVDVWLFSVENAPARASCTGRQARQLPTQKTRTTFAKQAATDPNKPSGRPAAYPPSFYRPAALVRLIVKRSRLRW